MPTPDGSSNRGSEPAPPMPPPTGDPLKAVVTELERICSQVEQMPPAGAAKAAQPQTTYSYNPPAPPRQRPTQEGGVSHLVVGIGVGAGAIAVLVVLAILLPRFLGQGKGDGGSEAALVAAAEEVSDPQDETQPAAPAKPTRRILLTRPVTAKPKPGSESPAKPRPPAAPPTATANNSQPQGAASATPPPAATPAAPPKPFEPSFDGLPKAVDLPPLKNVDGPVSLGKLEVPEQGRCQMTVVYGIPEEVPPFQFNITTSANEPRLWRVSMSPKVANPDLAAAQPPTEIAQLELESGELYFRWLPDCVKAPSDNLRNALLWVQVENKRHRLQLRKPVLSVPLLLDLETAQEVSFSPAALPPLGALQLELLEATAPPVVQMPSRRARGDDSLRLTFHRGPPAAEVRLKLEVEDGKAHVRVEPCLVDADGDVLPLTITDLDSMQKELPLEIRRTEKELEDVRENLASLQTRIARTSSALGPNAKENPQLASLRTSLGRQTDRERTLAQRVPVLKQRAAALPDLVKLANQMHQKTQLRFRVFFISGGEEVTLLGM